MVSAYIPNQKYSRIMASYVLSNPRWPAAAASWFAVSTRARKRIGTTSRKRGFFSRFSSTIKSFPFRISNSANSRDLATSMWCFSALAILGGIALRNAFCSASLRNSCRLIIMINWHTGSTSCSARMSTGTPGGLSGPTPAGTAIASPPRERTLLRTGTVTATTSVLSTTSLSVARNLFRLSLELRFAIANLLSASTSAISSRG